MTKHPSAHMGVGRGRFRKALRAVLLSKHATPDLEPLVCDELGWNCIYCGASGDSERLQLDHLWPESQGGCLVIGNVVPACPTCNSDRRQIPWQEFLRTSGRVTNSRTPDEIEQRIKTVAAYMERHNQGQTPTLETMLNSDELSLLADFDILLSALSDGSLAKAGHEKKSAINFDNPGQMFDELVAVARNHRRDTG